MAEPATLRQLPYRNQPWRVAVICMMLNRTRGIMAQPVIDELFSRWPTPELLSNASNEEVEDLIRPLGMWRKRAQHLRLMSARWAVIPPTTREELELFPGIGKYGADCWEIVCQDRLDVNPTDKRLMEYVTFARAIVKDTT